MTLALGLAVLAGMVLPVDFMSAVLALRHNALIRHKSTLQTATGINAPKLVQKSMGMSAGRSIPASFFMEAAGRCCNRHGSR